MSHFDKEIKDKLQFHSVDVPDDMWDRIEAGLPKNKRKRRFFGGYLTAAVSLFLVLGISSYTLFINKNQLDPSKYPSINHTLNSNTSVESNEKFQVNSSISNEGDFSDLTQLFPSKSISISFLLKNTNLLSQNNSYVSPLNHLAVKILSQKTPYSIIKNSKLDNSVNNVSIQDMQAETVINVNANQDITPLTILQTIPTAKLYSNEVSNLNFKKTKEPEECLRLNKVKIKAFADLYYSNDLPIRNIESKSENFNTYVRQREETEKVQYSFSAGLRIGMGITNKINLMTGAQYSQINEKFEYTDPESSQTKVITTKFYIKDINGNIVDSTSSEETVVIPGTLSYKINNVFRAIDIPFILGYQIYDSKKINLYANIGAYANMSFSQKGMVLSPNNSTALNLANPQNNIYISDLGFSTYLGLAMTYNIDPKLSILVEPTMRNHLKSITLKDHPTSHSYTILGISTGVRMIF